MKSFVTLATVAAVLWLALQALDATLTMGGGASGGKGAIPGFLTDYESALSLAKAESKPVIAVFSADWCPPCRQMKKDVYPSSEVRAYRDQFVWAYLDVDAPGNRTFAQKHAVHGIPHVQFLGPTGNDLGKVVGGCSPTQFASELQSVLAKAR